jgi:hypothetical protein
MTPCLCTLPLVWGLFFTECPMTPWFDLLIESCLWSISYSFMDKLLNLVYELAFTDVWISYVNDVTFNVPATEYRFTASYDAMV